MERTEPSPRPPAQSSGRPIIAIKTGYLMKEGKVVHNWRRRYFVLTGDFLSYAPMPEEPAIRSIGLRDIISVSLESYKNIPNGLAVKTVERIYHLSADDGDSRQSWLRALQETLNSLS